MARAFEERRGRGRVRGRVRVRVRGRGRGRGRGSVPSKSTASRADRVAASKT